MNMNVPITVTITKSITNKTFQSSVDIRHHVLLIQRAIFWHVKILRISMPNLSVTIHAILDRNTKLILAGLPCLRHAIPTPYLLENSDATTRPNDLPTLAVMKLVIVDGLCFRNHS